MSTVVKTTFQLKRGTAAKWVELNLVLLAGEPGFEIDTYRLKIGDGHTPWLDLPYIGEGSVVSAATHYDFPETGAANIIYKATEEKLLYQWNSDIQAYELLGMSGEGSNLIIDTELSESSTNAIANSAVVKALKELETKIPSTLPNYEFGEGIKVQEIDGIQLVSIDTDYIHQLIPEIDLSGYLTESDLAGLATEEFVLQKIAEAELVDLSNYYTKDEVDAKIPNVDNFATKEYVNEVSADINTLLETNYITIEEGVTKEELTAKVQQVIATEVEDMIDNKISEGVIIQKMTYGTF